MFKVLDLFSGIGGFALATKWAGGETIAFAEVAKYPSLVLSNRFPQVPNLGDVTKLCRRLYDCEQNDDGDFWCVRCDEEFGDCQCIGTDEFIDTHGFPDVITAGVPCQPASLVGKRLGESDDRWMWPDTLRVISELRPRFAILENPRSIITLDDGAAFSGILREFSEIGYDVQWEVVPACVVGAGHRRERLWILATNSDSTGLEGYTWHGSAGWETQANRYAAESDLRTRTIDSRCWYRQSGIEPVVDGVSGGMAKNQLMAIGNSLVPQVAFVWLATIAEFFKTDCTNTENAY